MTKAAVTRATLVKTIYREMGLSRIECAELLEDFLRTITDHLAKGTTVKITDFGSFSVRHIGPRMGLNPKTGEKVPISARRVIVFKPARKLKRRVNQSEGPHAGLIE